MRTIKIFFGSNGNATTLRLLTRQKKPICEHRLSTWQFTTWRWSRQAASEEKKNNNKNRIRQIHCTEKVSSEKLVMQIKVEQYLTLRKNNLHKQIFNRWSKRHKQPSCTNSRQRTNISHLSSPRKWLKSWGKHPKICKRTKIWKMAACHELRKLSRRRALLTVSRMPESPPKHYRKLSLLRATNHPLRTKMAPKPVSQVRMKRISARKLRRARQCTWMPAKLAFNQFRIKRWPAIEVRKGVIILIIPSQVNSQSFFIRLLVLSQSTVAFHQLAWNLIRLCLNKLPRNWSAKSVLLLSSQMLVKMQSIVEMRPWQAHTFQILLDSDWQTLLEAYWCVKSRWQRVNRPQPVTCSAFMNRSWTRRIAAKITAATITAVCRRWRGTISPQRTSTRLLALTVPTLLQLQPQCPTQWSSRTVNSVLKVEKLKVTWRISSLRNRLWVVAASPARTL